MLCYLLCKWQKAVFVRFLQGLPAFVVAPQTCESVLFTTIVSCIIVVACLAAAYSEGVRTLPTVLSQLTRLLHNAANKNENKIVRIIIKLR